MRIEKLIQVEDQLVEIEIDANDVISALYATGSEDGYSPHQQVIRAVNALSEVFRKMPQEGVDGLTQEQFERFKEAGC